MEGFAMTIVDGYYERVSKSEIDVIGKIVRLGRAGRSTVATDYAMRPAMVSMTFS